MPINQTNVHTLELSNLNARCIHVKAIEYKCPTLKKYILITIWETGKIQRFLFWKSAEKGSGHDPMSIPKIDNSI